MKEIIVQLTDEDYKVLEWQVPDPDQWVKDAVVGKVSNSKGRMLLELSDKRPDKIDKTEADTLIRNSTLKTRKERDTEGDG